MSIIVDYLKKTEQDAPPADKPSTVPPALLRTGGESRRGRTVLRLFYIGGIGALCVLICLFFLPRLKPGIADVESDSPVAALSPSPTNNGKPVKSNGGKRSLTAQRDQNGTRKGPGNSGKTDNGAGIASAATASLMPESSASNGISPLPSSPDREEHRERSISQSLPSTRLNGIPSFTFGTPPAGKAESGISTATAMIETASPPGGKEARKKKKTVPSTSTAIDGALSAVSGKTTPGPSSPIQAEDTTSSGEPAGTPGEKPPVQVASAQKINPVNQPGTLHSNGAGKPSTSRKTSSSVGTDGRRGPETVSVEKPRENVLAASEETGERPPAAGPSNQNDIPLKPKAPKQAGKERKASPEQNTTHLYQMGLLAQKKGNFSEAEAFYRRVLAVDSENLPTLTNLAATHIRQGEYQDAARVVDKILSIDPENPKALVNSGMIHLKNHRYDQAERLFTRVLVSRPTDEAALINLAYLARKKGDTPLLETYYKKIVRAHPGNTSVLLSYASLMETEKRWSEAVSLYIRCLGQKKIMEDKPLSRRIKKRIGVLERYAKP